MKKGILIIIALIVVAIFVILGLRFLAIGGSSDCRSFLSGEDCWLCQNGQWIKHGNPSAVKPTSGCGDLTSVDIKITTPQPNDIISSPLTIKGEARGSWFFEAVFPVKLLDGNGNIIASGPAQAQKDWMTQDFVPFKVVLEFTSSVTQNGTIVFANDNPSGLPQNEKKFEIPIRFIPAETMRIKVYFNNSNMDPEFSCNKVFPIERDIIKTEGVARAALEELLKGPTENEKKQGFFTTINAGVKIQKLTIDDGIAKVDFDEQLEYQVGGSCRVSAIRAEIRETLKQFPTVKDVVISINGRTEYILQP